MRRVLVVANQTLGGDELLEAIKSRMAQEPCEFTLLVPATPSPGPGSGGGGSTDIEWRGTARMTGDYILPAGDGYAEAQSRLELGLRRLRDLGATVDGDVGDPNPFDAIRDLVGRRQFDEVIISTLPSGASRWLRQDLPHRVERKFHRPVTVVTAQRPPRR
jgi:hypothetical protein